MDQKELVRNAIDYCKISGIEIFENTTLGHGTDGSVWETSNRTALKAFYREQGYRNEVECYHRLKLNGIITINGFSVPHLEGKNDQLMVIEMTYVQPPYLLDFGKVYLDRPPPYQNDEYVMAAWNEKLQEEFGDNTTKVYGLLHQLKKLGIYYVDPRPANINFGDED